MGGFVSRMVSTWISGTGSDTGTSNGTSDVYLIVLELKRAGALYVGGDGTSSMDDFYY